MARTALLALLGALAACSAEPAPSDRAADRSKPVSSDSPAPAPAPAQRIAWVDEIWGQWRLVSLTGAESAGGHRIHLLIGRQGIEAVSQCVPFNLPLPFPVPPPPPRRRPQPPEPVCARTLSATEQTFPQVIHSTDRVERRAEGRIAFVGRRGEAVLERPPEPVTNPFENEPGPGPWAMWGAWRVAEIGGRPVAGEPIRLLFRRRGVEAMSGCVAMSWRLGQDGGRLSFERETWVGGVCERMPRPEETMLETVLSGDLAIARSTPTERLLSGRNGSLLLRR
jgi:hypothetical protein